MVAVSYIETKTKVFAPGETVKGLSKADADWMKEKGYIKDDEPKEPKKGTKNEMKDGPWPMLGGPVPRW